MDIIRDIMDISKIEKGTIELEQIPFDLEEVIEQTFRQVTVSAARKQLELILDYPLSLPHLFTGDPTRIKEILVNLISNAVKFTSTGYVLLRVEYLSCQNKPATITLSVIDSGRGVPLDLQPVIFDIFTQADNDSSFANSGSGLGLSITHQLVEAMHGTITVSSVPGNGATFSINLPLTPRQPCIEIPATLNAVRILVADTHSVCRTTVSEGCRLAGMHCTAVSTLPEVLEKVSQEKFDFAILNRNITDSCSPATVKQIAESLTYANRGLLILCKISNTSYGELCSHAVCISQPISIRKICSVIQMIIDSPDTPPLQKTGTDDLYGDILKLSTGKRCLLVEDNVINQKVTSAILRKLGYDVDLAENGQRALDMIDHYSYTVILMDCQMPVMDGYRATQELRMRNVTTPIIGVTANAMEDDRDKCLKAGMDDYLPKPVKIASMKALLQHWDS
jgi:CheY-like chemotaxis protein